MATPSYIPNSGFQSPQTIAARMNLAPVPARAPVPVALKRTVTATPLPVRTIGQAVGQAAQFTVTRPITTASATDVNGPGPSAGGSPGSPSAMSGALQSLPPAARTLAKVVPFVAAVFFLNKGDHVLAAVSAAAGGAALLWL